jgi:predicted NBD/HSP70 family sugar kinase/biotin operon repressor
MPPDTPSSPVARQQSIRLVIERLLRDGSVSRAEIARSTGLSKQTISEVMRDLERDGWVVEDGQIQGSVGRSALTYALRPDAAFVLGIDLGGTKLHVALADLRGAIVTESVEPTTADGGAAVVAQIGRMADALLARAGVAQQNLRGAVMGSPGMVDPKSGGIVIAPNIAGLDSLDVRATLQARLGVEIAIENDVNLAAIGEHWRGNSRTVQNFAFIAVGTGIGMGIFAGGHLVRGARGSAGEIAYLPLGGDPYDARALRLGTLETSAASAGIAARYVGLGGAPGTSVRAMFDRLETDAAARITLDEVGRVIASAILAVHSILDPQIVVMGGSIGARPELKRRIEAHLKRCMREPVPIELSALGNRATLIGAIGGAVDLVHRTLFGVGADAGPLALPLTSPTEAAA